MLEFTGNYWKCLKCNYVWDYNDTACPNCGSQNCEDINENDYNIFKNNEQHGNTAEPLSEGN